MFSPIEYIGINTNLPTNINFFKEKLFYTNYVLGDNQPQIKKIISVSINHKIISIKLIKTSKGISDEGQNLSGKQLLVELNINYKVKYLSTNTQGWVHILNHNITKVMYIVIPSVVEKRTIEKIIREKKLRIKTYVEDLYADIRNDKEIYIRSLILVNVFIKKIKYGDEYESRNTYYV